MKKILFLLVLLYSQFSYGQTVPDANYTPETWRKFLGTKADSIMRWPLIDTTSARYKVRGNVTLLPGTNTPYYYNGFKWLPFLTDSAGVINKLNLKVDSVTNINNYLCYWVNGTSYCAQLNKVDSVKAHSDSLFYFIASDSTFFYLAGASGANYNLNSGAGYRLALPYTPNIKTVFGGYAINIDSVTTNILSWRLDTTNIHTKPYYDSLYLRSFTYSDANGLDGTVTGGRDVVLSVTSTVSNNQVMYSTSGAFTGSGNLVFDGTRLSVTNNGLGVTQSDNNGFQLINGTAAAAGAQQISPSIHWAGQGWKTASTAASQSVDFRAYVLPVQGSANPQGTWKLQQSINGASYGDVIAFGSAGELYANGSAGTSGQSLTSGGIGAPFTWTTITGGSGTVTSVAMSVPSLLTVSGSPITTSGTFGVTWNGVTTGGLLYGSGTNTAANLGIGTTGQKLVVVGGLPVWKDTAAVVVYTADNGLTMSTSSNTQLGSTSAPGSALLHNSYINADVYGLIMTGSQLPFKSTSTSILLPAIQGNNASNGIGVEGNATGGIAISGVLTNGVAALSGQTNGSGLGLDLIISPTSTNTIATIAKLSRATSGTAANGIGGSIDFLIESDNGSPFASNSIVSKFSNAVAASRTSEVDITGVVSASAETFMNIQGLGIVRVNNNADTLATKAYARSVSGGGGGGSGLDVGSTAITSGTTTRVLYDNAGVLGEYSITGTGNVVMSGTPTIVTPSFTTGFTIGGAAATGKFIVGNGTNYVASTSTIPTSAGATVGKLLVSDGTNYILSTAVLIGGTNSISLGKGSTDAPGTLSISLGYDISNNYDKTIAIGAGAAVNADSAISIGRFSAANLENSIAIGNRSIANDRDAIAIGRNDSAMLEGSISIGGLAASRDDYGVAIGYNAKVNNQYGTALGYGAYSTGVNSTAIGYNATTTGANQIVLGTSTEQVIVPGSINGRWVPRVGSTTSSGTPTINTNVTDIYKLTAQAANITSMTTNLTGTPNDGDILEIDITGTGSFTLAWGASFASGAVALPTTITTTTQSIILQWKTTSSYGNNKWICYATY